ncbi:MAG: hypothetical protein MNPFHGCM_02910 [Gemmatimonadaceae bacterium]|nr:hypothetical protein [Gemmatimonadaceae bacterium]
MVLRRGEMRIGILTNWSFAGQRFGRAGTGAAGRPEPLGTDYTRAMDAGAFEQLASVQTSLEQLLGTSVDPLSAGSLRTTMDLAVVTTPITVDVGLTDRFMLSIVAPYVKNRNDVTVYANTPPGTANVGLNPGLFFASTRNTNAQVVSQLTAAATKLGTELARCAQSTDPACSAINADRAGATALTASATSAAAIIGRLYGTTTAAGSVFAPLGGSALQAAVYERLTAMALQFGRFLGAPPAAQSWIDARPVGSNLLAYNDFQTLLTDSTSGIGAVPLETVERSHLSDISLGGKFLLFDSTKPDTARGGMPRPGTRLAVSALYRPGTAQLDSPDNFGDVGTGDHQADIELAAYADAVFTRRLWASVVARYAVQQADELPLRIPARPGDPFPAQYRRQSVQRNLGDAMSLEITPRYAPSEVLTIAASYRLWKKGADAYSGTFTVPDLSGATVNLDASALNVTTDQQEQRAGVSVTYSSVQAWERRRARWPVEVALVRWQSLTGTNAVTKFTTTALGVRYYSSLFGAPLRPPRPTTSASPLTR